MAQQNEERYSTAQIVAMTGFSHRQLTYWAKHGIVAPSIQKSRGPGTRRVYGFKDVVRLRLLRQLKQAGWSVQKIRLAMDNLGDLVEGDDPLRVSILLGGGKSILALYKTPDGETHLAEALASGGQQVLPIALATLEDEARNVVQAFSGLSK